MLLRVQTYMKVQDLRTFVSGDDVGLCKVD